MCPNDQLPKRYRPAEIEAKWRRLWEERRVYAFDPESDRPTFSIDTPPPTVSGTLHVGHAFSYVHTDLVARFQRMRGNNVFYPMGWDDNGLPTERRVQNLCNVRCDARVPYDPHLQADLGSDRPRPISRRNFLELCAQVAARDEAAFEETWRRLGLSVDWAQTYATNDACCRRISQLAFLELVRKGEAYSADAPTVWDVDFRTAVAQAETEEREVEGLEFRLRFGIEGGGTLHIMTTRPELLAACVGVIVHPDDARYSSVLGGTAITPAYRTPVPILAHPLAEPDKGTGAVMLCTFGDATDVTWWRELRVATRMIVGRDGRLLPVRWGSEGCESLDPAAAQRIHDGVAGLAAHEAKLRMAQLLADPGTAADGTGLPPLEGEPTPVRQAVKFYEKGERPLETLLTRQWFIRLLDKKEALLERGRQVRWHPPFMRKRYEQWVQGLRQDWCVSRQRYLGVPIPLWYPLDDRREPDYVRPILPPEDRLPVDPLSEPPPGFEESQRGQPNGFTADGDVLDTWATSSLTPQIATGRRCDQEMRRRLYPMDIRPQAHDIIRTWAFYTIARAHMQDDGIPWRNAVISGWVREPDRKKMSKSRGTDVSPALLLDRYGADAVRYWAASARLGMDAVYDEAVFKVGKRLVTKLFNAGKLIVGRLRGGGMAPDELSAADVRAPLDRAHLTLLGCLISRATDRMGAFETAAALDAIETWFWSNLCDNYLELTKNRAYAGDPSALAAWSLSLSITLRLLAPFLPYITEEVWSWCQGSEDASIHAAAWPTPAEVAAAAGRPEVFQTAVAVLTQIRRQKTEAGLSLRAPVGDMTVAGPAGQLEKLERALGDVMSAGAVRHADLLPKEGPGLVVSFDIAGA